jgi:transcriptional regulator with XRE-family HTH domain
MKNMIEVYWVFDMEKFGNDVRQSRIDAHLTQQELGEILGVEGTTVSGWERNHHPSVFIGNFVGACNLFDLDPRHYWTTTR